MSINIIQFKDRITDASIYPVTKINAISDSDNCNLTTYITEYVLNAHDSSASIENGYVSEKSYTIEEAVLLVPDEYKLGGLKLTFRDAERDNKFSSYITYDGGKTYTYIDNGGGSPSISNLIIEVTYSELGWLRQSGTLIPGAKYRITDYVTTTSQENTRSAEHRFDVIVTALDNSHLSEEARATYNRDDNYFKNNGADVPTWKIWYCFDNNADRFFWADEEDGTGVIYRMIDEWQNDCGYDFKNILFPRNMGTNEVEEYDEENPDEYTDHDNLDDPDYVPDEENDPDNIDGDRNGLMRSAKPTGLKKQTTEETYYCLEESEWERESIDRTRKILGLGERVAKKIKTRSSQEAMGSEYWVYTFSMINLYTDTVDDLSVMQGKYSDAESGIYFHVRDNKFDINYQYKSYDQNEENEDATRIELMVLPNNIFVTDTHECNISQQNKGFYRGFYGNMIGKSSMRNTFGNACTNNIIGTACTGNSFGPSCINNKLDTGCYRNQFSNGSYSNTLHIECGDNVIWSGYYNEFGDLCYGNSIMWGNNNKLDGACDGISLSDSNLNTFGTSCSGISLYDYCESNTFGKYCSSMDLEACQHNTFGQYCGGNIIGQGCIYNQFGNNFTNNELGMDSRYNTFGQSCKNNSFGESFSFNQVGNGCEYIRFSWDDMMISPGNDIRYVTINNGCKILNIYPLNTATAIRNMTIASGVSGTLSYDNGEEEEPTYQYLPIEIPVSNQNYEIRVAKTSNGTLRIYCPDDIAEHSLSK